MLSIITGNLFRNLSLSTECHHTSLDPCLVVSELYKCLEEGRSTFTLFF